MICTCGKPITLTDDELKTLWGRRNHGRRVTPAKAGPGRPACHCGQCGACLRRNRRSKRAIVSPATTETDQN